jgi:hypothetical protein
VRQRHRAAGEHPLEIHALIDSVGVPRHVGVVAEAAPYRQNAREEQRCVDRRQLALPLPRTGLQVDEVVEPAMLLRHLLGEPTQRRLGALDCCSPRLPAASGGNAQAAQPEADGRDAADAGGVLAGGTPVGPRPVPDDAGAGIRLFPEERKRAP